MANRWSCRIRRAARWLLLLALLLTGACSAPRPSAPPALAAAPTAPRAPATAVATLVANRLPTPTLAPTATPPPTATPTPTPSCAQPGGITFGTFDSTIAGPARPYRIYLPPCFGQDGRRYPTLYLLHGNVRADDEWDTIGIDEKAEALIASGQIPPLLIVMPDGRPLSDVTSGGPYSYEAVLVEELFPHIEATWCGTQDGPQRAIGGLSRGGYWAAEIAFRQPWLFGSVGLHAPAFLDIMQDPTINPIYTALTNDLGTLRIAFDFGANDHLLWPAQELHAQMTEAGVAHSWTVHPVGVHDDPYWSDHAADYLTWYAAIWPAVRTAYAPCNTP